MNRRDLHFNSLRAFESAARHRSLSRAAQELCVTHSAISHQIKHLEQSLGVPLFHRSNRGIQLTGAGETLLPVLIDAFDRISNTLDGFSSKKAGRALHVTTTPAFASKWLVPRMSRWNDRKNHIRLYLLPTLTMLDIARGEADVGIRCGNPPWPGLKEEFLLPVHMTPICSPEFLRQHGPFDHLEDIFRVSLIHADVGSHRLGEEWRTWLSAAGAELTQGVDGLSFNDPWLATQAAMDGLGLAIGYREFIEADLLAGRLVQPFDMVARHAFSYYLVYPIDKETESKVGYFRNWVFGQADSGVRPTPPA